MTGQDEPTQLALEQYRALTGGALATEVLEIIEENLARWDQGAWRRDDGPWDEQICSAPVSSIEAFAEDPLNPACTTSFCMAGWIGAVKGVKWVRGERDLDQIGKPKGSSVGLYTPECTCTGFCCIEPAHRITIESYAAEQLGIEIADADRLFSSENSLEDLRVGVTAIVNGDSVRAAIDMYDDDSDDNEEDQ